MNIHSMMEPWRGNSTLVTSHYPDLGKVSDYLKQIFHAAQPIRSTIQSWAVTSHQYGISAPVSQALFRGETSDVAKCRLFSQAKRRYVSSPFRHFSLFLFCFALAKQTTLEYGLQNVRRVPSIFYGKRLLRICNANLNGI